jgi:N-methylhydantoinase B
MSNVVNVGKIDQAIIGQALLSTAREMGAKLYRSAYSSIVRDAKDASTGILDVTGAAVAQSDELIPLLVGSLSLTFRACARRFPVETLKEGDFYITNHAYEGGQHLQDIFVFMPIFVGETLVGFSAAVAHHLDIGGGAPGLNNLATDLYQEGFIIPPSKYNLEADWANEGPLQRLFAANIRVPDQTVGDMDSQFAACQIGIERVRELCGKYSTTVVRDAMDNMIDYVERRFRAAIAVLPDGVYVGEDMIDDDGLGTEPLHVKATVTIRGDQLAVDFAGTSPQVKKNLNAPFASVVSSTLACLKGMLTSDDVIYNEGANRAITISAPEGSLLNPRFPAPVRARLEAAYRAYDCVMKAIVQAMPARGVAVGYDCTTGFCLSQLKDGRYKIFIELPDGGYGGSVMGDGCDAVSGPLSNCATVPIECVDADFDFFRIEGFGFVPNSGGTGRYRGGLGSFRTYRILQDDVRLAIYSDRFTTAAQGAAGGGPGQSGQCEVQRGEQTISVRSKDDLMLMKGDVVTIRTGGGGGYGDAAERDPALIARDRADGFVLRS